MNQKLTSRFPLFVRALVMTVWGLPFWVAVFYFVPPSILLEWRWAGVALAVCQLLFLCFLILRLKDVWIDENSIYLATLFRKSQAPLEAITSVTEDNRGRVKEINIVFAQQTDIGTKLSFIPYFSLAFFKKHPAVDDIERLVMDKNQRMERYGAGLADVLRR